MNPANFMYETAIAFLAALAVIVAYQMLTGSINLRGLLQDGNRNLSPGRIQALLATLTGGATYLLAVKSNLQAQALPAAPGELLAVMGGSHAIYLLGKLKSVL